MDSEYYEFIRAGRKETGGLPWVGAEHLIPLKASAWLDLARRKADRQDVDSRAIRKHKNDVFRLYQIITPLEQLPPPQVRQDLTAFILKVKAEGVDLKALKVSGSLPDILVGLARAYHCEAPTSGRRTLATRREWHPAPDWLPGAHRRANGGRWIRVRPRQEPGADTAHEAACQCTAILSPRDRPAAPPPAAASLKRPDAPQPDAVVLVAIGEAEAL